MRTLVCDPARIYKLGARKMMPSGIYPGLLTEAIFQRELHTIHYLVSTWQAENLDMRSVVPVEDMLDAKLWTSTVSQGDSLSIMDSIIYGLLDQKPESKLKQAIFVGFRQGRYDVSTMIILPSVYIYLHLCVSCGCIQVEKLTSKAIEEFNKICFNQSTMIWYR